MCYAEKETMPPKQSQKMADMEIPIQGKLIVQKVTKNELQVELMIQKIKSCEGSKSDVANLRNEARKTMQAIKSDLEGLQEIKEIEDGRTQTSCLEEVIATHKKTMMSLQVNLRKANLFAEGRLGSSQRYELLSNLKEGDTDNSMLHRRKKSQEKATRVASNITANLIKVAEMMNSQVGHSIESTRVLEESSKQLGETQEELKGMTGVIQMSKKLINKYSRRELTDTLLIFFGLVLFFSTVIYIILKRI